MKRASPLVRLAALWLLLALGCAKAERLSPAPSAAAPSGAGAKNDAVSQGVRRALLEVRLELAAQVPGADDARRTARALEARAAELGGWVESASVSDAGGHLVLRVPTARLDEVRSVLAATGPIAREARTAKDVTDAVVDLDARAKAAHAEEARLLDLLQTKTGNLADVLAVEKALAEVRERVERLEAEQRAAHGRVDLATVDVSLELRGALDALPLGHQLAVAGREGLVAARETVVLGATTALRVGPTASLLLLVGLPSWRLLRRARVQRAQRAA